MESGSKFHTCPARLRKRDVPAIWDLFDNPRDSRCDSPSTVNDEDSVTSLGLAVAPDLSRRSSMASDSGQPVIEAGGSWPRIRKQRTGEGRSMSLFDVAEALEQQHLDVKDYYPDMVSSAPTMNGGAVTVEGGISTLEALVAAEQEAAAHDEAGSNVSVESFVEAVFRGIAPNPDRTVRNSEALASAASATTAQPTNHPRAHTANDLALLQAIAADQEAAAAQAAAQAAAAKAKAAKAKAVAAAANAAVAAKCRNSLSTAGTTSSNANERALLAPSIPALANKEGTDQDDSAHHLSSEMTSDDLLSMLQMDLASPSAMGDVKYTMWNDTQPSTLTAADHLHPTASSAGRSSPFQAAVPSANGEWVYNEAYWMHRDASTTFDDASPHAPESSVGFLYGEQFGMVDAEHLQFQAANDLATDYATNRLGHAMGSTAAVEPAALPQACCELLHHYPHVTASANDAQQANGGHQLLHVHTAGMVSSMPLPAPLGLSHPAMQSVQPVSKPARNGAERKEWTDAEDAIIKSSVVEYGCRWRKIAAQLPGRSDDAVRNRWNRLREIDAAAASDGSVSHPAAGGVPASTGSSTLGGMAAPRKMSSDINSKADKDKPERVSWTKAEDETILRSVAELGHKWNKIAERLPGRTDHAIRNRFHRLQSLLEDRQRQQQRSLAPAQPLIVSGLAAGPPIGAKQPTDVHVDILESDGFDTPSGGRTTPNSR